MDKKEQLKNALKELEKAIADIKKKYGNEIDADFLQKKFEEIISNSTKNKWKLKSGGTHPFHLKDKSTPP